MSYPPASTHWIGVKENELTEEKKKRTLLMKESDEIIVDFMLPLEQSSFPR